jgi:hypothetical protein
VPLPVGEWREIQANLTADLETIYEAKATLEQYGVR